MPFGGQGPLYCCLPKLFVPCTPGALFSSIRLVMGIFHITQWVNMPLGASGSSRIKARHLAVSGIVPMCKAGLISFPSQVYCEGIRPPSVKAGLVMVNFETTVTGSVAIIFLIKRQNNHAMQ